MKVPWLAMAPLAPLVTVPATWVRVAPLPTVIAPSLVTVDPLRVIEASSTMPPGAAP